MHMFDGFPVLLLRAQHSEVPLPCPDHRRMDTLTYMKTPFMTLVYSVDNYSIITAYMDGLKLNVLPAFIGEKPVLECPNPQVPASTPGTAGPSARRAPGPKVSGLQITGGIIVLSTETRIPCLKEAGNRTLLHPFQAGRGKNKENQNAKNCDKTSTCWFVVLKRGPVFLVWKHRVCFNKRHVRYA